jgi:uncharacterized protein YaaR (DUF327 family)
MKVREGIGTPKKIGEVHTKEEKRVVESKNISFQNQLKKAENQNYDEYLKRLMDDIFNQGEKLSKKIDIMELKRYKALISEFLLEATSNSQKFNKDSFLDRRGRHRTFVTVKKVNEELEALTKEVLNNEKDNIKILNKIGDIRGLILDMVL